MIRIVIMLLVAVAFADLAPTAQAQQPRPPGIRALGPITNVSHDSLSSVTAAVQVAGGRVYVNDIIGHRVLLYDSALASAVVVADSAEGPNTYGSRPGTLLPFHGDSALFVTPATLSMLVLSPSGAIVRVMAMPPSGRGMPALIGNIFGTPGFDARGRLVFFSPGRPVMPGPPREGASVTIQQPDSAFLARFDFTTRTLDTAGAIRIPQSRSTVNQGADPSRMNFTITAFPPRIVDDWAVTTDGSIAVVRGQDYHVDWLNPDGTRTSSPRIPFEWEQLNDEGKAALLDSTVTGMQRVMDSARVRLEQAGNGGNAVVLSGPQGGSPPARRDSANRGGRGGRAPAGASMPMPTIVRAQLADVPDYRPPFRQGAVRADADGNLWIRTTKILDKRPVYDVVNRAGQLTDRVQLPEFRTIAGFGPGVIYLAVKDSTGVAHLERARIK